MMTVIPLLHLDVPVIQVRLVLEHALHALVAALDLARVHVALASGSAGAEISS
jgi:hypothetical protein